MRVAVVGGGIVGLTAAWALVRAGHHVTLLESEPRLGGKIRTERSGGFLFEAGPDSFVTIKPHAVALCQDLGLGGELVAARPGHAYVWARGTLHPIPEGTRLLPTRMRSLMRSHLFSPAEKARIVADLTLPGAAGEGDTSLGRLVERRMGRAMVDRLAGPLLAGIHAADPDRLSVEATFPSLLEAERGHGSLIRGLRAKRAHRRGSTFATLAGGLETLVARLARALEGADVRIGAAVRALTREPGRETAGRARVATWRLELEGAGVEADGVVLAVPSYESARLVAGTSPRAAALLAGIDWVSTAVVTLGYREGDAPVLAGHGFVVARDQAAAITGSTWVSSKWPGRAPEGHVLVRAYLGNAMRPVDLEAGDEELAGAARDDLARAMGLAAEPVLCHVARWPRAMPQFAVGHLARIAAAERDLARLPRIALAGPGTRGSGIPDGIAQGFAAARRVTEGLSTSQGQPSF